jgi:hypothetical protein
MKKPLVIGVIALLTSSFFSSPAQAVAVLASNSDASGLCTQEINSSASVTITRSGSECIIRFAPTSTTTYTWNRPSGITNFRVLLIGGGGGGGSNYGGGGGGGGFIDTNTVASTVTISITVGAGGAGSLNGNSTDAVSGSNSSFVSTSTLTAIGGGRAGSADLSGAGGSGGSGGGGGATSGAGGSPTINQGFVGGLSRYFGTSDSVATGGGGGAGAAGSAGSFSSNVSGGAGGVGKSSDITGATVFYAGGGGGGTHTGHSGICAGTAAGGNGGGGAAGTCRTNTNNSGSAGTSGTNGLGGGGGGGSVFTGRTNDAFGGNGGSGVVIVRFTADIAPVITGPNSATGATSSISITENTTSVFTFTANETVTWSLAGVDSATFSITSGGVLTTVSKDFEAPNDSDLNNTYVVIIRATDSLSLQTSQTLTVTVTNLNESAQITNVAFSALIYKGTTTTISVSLNTPGRLRFFVNGKRITSCLARATTGSYPSASGTCSWKPAVTGRNFVTVQITPTDNTFSTVSSSRFEVWVFKRAGNR